MLSGTTDVENGSNRSIISLFIVSWYSKVSSFKKIKMIIIIIYLLSSWTQILSKCFLLRPWQWFFLWPNAPISVVVKTTWTKTKANGCRDWVKTTTSTPKINLKDPHNTKSYNYRIKRSYSCSSKKVLICSKYGWLAKIKQKLLLTPGLMNG